MLLILLAAQGLAFGATGDFLAERALASRAAARTAQLSASAATLGEESRIAARLGLDAAPLKTGDEWWIAALLSDNAMARKTSPARAGASEPSVRYYHFKVGAVTAGLASVTVTSTGLAPLELTLDRRYRLLAVRGGKLGVGLDYFPVSIPRFNDETLESADAPALPAALAKLDVAEAQNALAYTSEDSLARPSEVVWAKGEPWPLLLKSPAGTAVLLKGAP